MENQSSQKNQKNRKRDKIRLEGGYRLEQEIAQFYISYVCPSCGRVNEAIARGITRINENQIMFRNVECECESISLLVVKLKSVIKTEIKEQDPSDLIVDYDTLSLEDREKAWEAYKESIGESATLYTTITEDISTEFGIPLGYHTLCTNCAFNISKTGFGGSEIQVKCLIGICAAVMKELVELKNNPIEKQKEAFKDALRTSKDKRNQERSKIIKVGCPDCSTVIPLPEDIYENKKESESFKCSFCNSKFVRLE